MVRVLTAENALIVTATVTVRALTIEKRQVTLSVFRQLQEAPIVDMKTLTLRGVGWGHVRYLIDEQPDQAIHLVWQKGSELRRGIVQRYMCRLKDSFENQWEDPVYYDPDHQEEGERRPAFFTYSRWRWKKKPAGTYYLGAESDHHANYADKDWKKKKELAQAEYSAAMESYRNLVRKCLRTEYDEHCAYCDRYEALVAPLFDMQQLFIAS